MSAEFYMFYPKEEKPLKYVHPLQHDRIKSLMQAEFPGYVKYVLLFGSSLDLTCNGNSDIDLYFIVDDGYDDRAPCLHEICQVMKCRFDLLISDQEDFVSLSRGLNTVQHEIMERSVIIYERKEEIHAAG